MKTTVTPSTPEITLEKSSWNENAKQDISINAKHVELRLTLSEYKPSQESQVQQLYCPRCNNSNHLALKPNTNTKNNDKPNKEENRTNNVKCVKTTLTPLTPEITLGKSSQNENAKQDISINAKHVELRLKLLEYKPSQENQTLHVYCPELNDLPLKPNTNTENDDKCNKDENGNDNVKCVKIKFLTLQPEPTLEKSSLNEDDPQHIYFNVTCVVRRLNFSESKLTQEINTQQVYCPSANGDKDTEDLRHVIWNGIRLPGKKKLLVFNLR